MPNRPFQSVASITESARQYTGTLVSPCGHLSLPIPVVEHAKPVFAYLLARAEIIEPGYGLQLWIPSYLVRFDSASGRLESIRSISPREVGFDEGTPQPLGRYLSPPEQRSDTILTARAQCDQACDALAAVFFSNSRPLTPALQSAVADYLNAFSVVAEAPWKSCYNFVGRNFFQWLKAAKPVMATASQEV